MPWHWRIMQNLKEKWHKEFGCHASSRKFKNLHSDGLLLSKTYEYLDEKVQNGNVLWH